MCRYHPKLFYMCLTRVWLILAVETYTSSTGEEEEERNRTKKYYDDAAAAFIFFQWNRVLRGGRSRVTHDRAALSRRYDKYRRPRVVVVGERAFSRKLNVHDFGVSSARPPNRHHRNTIDGYARLVTLLWRWRDNVPVSRPNTPGTYPVYHPNDDNAVDTIISQPSSYRAPVARTSCTLPFIPLPSPIRRPRFVCIVNIVVDHVNRSRW